MIIRTKETYINNITHYSLKKYSKRLSIWGINILHGSLGRNSGLDIGRGFKVTFIMNRTELRVHTILLVCDRVIGQVNQQRSFKLCVFDEVSRLDPWVVKWSASSI